MGTGVVTVMIMVVVTVEVVVTAVIVAAGIPKEGFMIMVVVTAVIVAAGRVKLQVTFAAIIAVAIGCGCGYVGSNLRAKARAVSKPRATVRAKTW